MANNPYVNKVNKANGDTIIDISDTTATASDVAQGKYFYLATGEKVQGSASGGAAIIVDTTDSHGGTIREITTVDEVYLQSSKSVTPTESAQTVEPDTGYDALESVAVGAISSTYVGSGITQRSSTDLSASGATVTAPAGYYSSSASKSVSSMTLPTSAASSATSGYSSKATISRSTSDQYINIPTGYNSTGAYYKVSATANGSVTAPSTISGTGASVTTGTNTLTLSKTVSVTPSVTTAGYVSSGTAGNSAVSLTASVNTRSSSDLTASGATVTAPAGYYSSAASKTVSSGTAGTPTATKGTVSNHTITVTPSVTNTTGYITGSTKTGTGVTVSASELVSGTKSITENGTGIDVAEYATVDVAIPGGGIDINDWATGDLPSTDVNLSATTIRDYGLYGYPMQVDCNAPDATYIGQSAFRDTRFTKIMLPTLNSGHATGYYFYGSNKATVIDCGFMPQVKQWTFTACSVLTSIILRSTTMIALDNTNAFNQTPYRSGGTGGTIYVPSALISSYQTATNWSTMYGYGTVTFSAIEGSVYE